jgi:hypothetical protein
LLYYDTNSGIPASPPPRPGWGGWRDAGVVFVRREKTCMRICSLPAGPVWQGKEGDYHWRAGQYGRAQDQAGMGGGGGLHV